MSVLADVIKELGKMFVADLRLTLAVVAGIAVVDVMIYKQMIGPLMGGLALTVICLAVLADVVMREARNRRGGG